MSAPASSPSPWSLVPAAAAAAGLPKHVPHVVLRAGPVPVVGLTHDDVVVVVETQVPAAGNVLQRDNSDGLCGKR